MVSPASGHSARPAWFVGTENDQRFAWTEFYAEVADNLLQYRYDRDPLAAAIADIARRRPELPFAIIDQFADGSTGPLQDICPFTVMGIFNRRLTDVNRHAIAAELAEFLSVTKSLPELSTNDNGIPLLHNLRSWFFHYARLRRDGDIDRLWQVFTDAIAFADQEFDPSAFIDSYDIAESQPLVAYNLTMGLYWARPWWYVPLDGNSRQYITKQLGVPLSRTVPSGADYVALCNRLAERFEEDNSPVHSFPELSWAAYQPDRPMPQPQIPVTSRESQPPPPSEPTQSYAIDDIIADGCFLDRPTLEAMLQRLQTKQNIILQGPPGTGKTWLAKKLAYAVIGNSDDTRVRPVQFHPNLSYEDFVRGWRPQSDTGLQLVDGPFLQLASDAKQDPDARYVMVVEEINRGIPASIFGELLTLLEADKRTPADAMSLAYPREPGERVHLPSNLYLIGTMNVADRSLAMVDFALRRRFAFFDLEPVFDDTWRDWVHDQCRIPLEFLDTAAAKMITLNRQIADDRNLGRQFLIGHSYVTPSAGVPINDPVEWFTQVVETEIVPLLHEYWFDQPDKVSDARLQLLSGL